MSTLCATPPRSSVSLAATLALLAACAPASSQAASESSLPPAATGPPEIAFVGASVTAGFRLADHDDMFSNMRARAEQVLGRELSDEEYERRTDSVAPGDVLAAVSGRSVESFGDTMLFASPERIARRVLEKGLETGADTVVGVDLMFWFGYGRVDDGGDEREERLALQRLGFDLLDELASGAPDVSFVLGDYPDLSRALPAMITPDMIPDAKTRKELNRRLAVWADERPNVSVFPISRSLDAVTRGTVRLGDGSGGRAIDLESAFQLAMVHPTRLGTAYLVRDLAKFLRGLEEPPVEIPRARDAAFLEAAGVRR
ncbi:MAG: hypothetical protein AAF957_12945 [Planctomycetota bacterium]